MSDLKNRIEHFFSAPNLDDPAALASFLELRDALESGQIRSAEPDSSVPLGWRVNAWVKQGILLGFRLGHLQAFGDRASGGLTFVDKHTFPAQHFATED